MSRRLGLGLGTQESSGAARPDRYFWAKIAVDQNRLGYIGYIG